MSLHLSPPQGRAFLQRASRAGRQQRRREAIGGFLPLLSPPDPLGLNTPEGRAFSAQIDHMMQAADALRTAPREAAQAHEQLQNARFERLENNVFDAPETLFENAAYQRELHARVEASLDSLMIARGLARFTLFEDMERYLANSISYYRVGGLM